MVAEKDVETIKKELATDTRDVADLWSDALRKYKGIVGEELMPKFANVDAMIKFGTQEMDSFHQFRHNAKKVDKLRSLFSANLDYIAKGTQQLIAAATPAFPPAAAIGTALTYMLTACKQVSADYDVVTAFFEDMGAFLQRITILESRLPKYPAYRNCLMDVFTSVLEMCGFATKYIELGRFKKWIFNMVKGEDGDLGGARKKMDTSLSRLQSATEYAILGNTEELQRMNTDLQQNQDMQTRMMEDQTKMLETVIQNQDNVRSDLQNIQKLLVMFKARDNTKQRAAAKAPGQSKKPPTSNQVRSFFLETLNPAHEYHGVKESFIPETCTWIFEEPLWASWLSREPDASSSRILALIGAAGTGKSHLAASAFDHLVTLAQKDTDSHTCVAQFYFRESTKDLDEIYKAVNWLVLQVAEHNAGVCEIICAQLQRDDLEIDGYDWKDVWTKLVQPCFNASTKNHLTVVWDGIDELPEWERDPLWELFTLVKDTADLNVKFVCTTREFLEEPLQKAGAQFVKVTKEKQLPDLKALIWHHLNNDSGLRKFSKYAKQTISSTLEEKSDGMLYAEHLLRQFSIYGREPLVLKVLAEQMPIGLEGLYLNMVADLQHHTPEGEVAAIKTLLCWLAHSYRALTLAECLSLLAITSNTSLDLERELQGRQLARILCLGDLEERITDTEAEDIKLSILAENKTDTVTSDGDLPLKFQERSMAGFFRGASSGLRTEAVDGHREIFILCSDVLCGKRPNADKGLRQYAARFWLLHLSWTYLEADSETDRIRALNALGTLMSNETDVATVLEDLEIDYEDISENFDSGLVMKDMAMFAGLAVALKDKVSPTTNRWASSVTASVHAAFEPLARGHMANWFHAEEPKLALRCFKFARSAINMKNKVDADAAEDAESGDDDDSDYSYDIFYEQSHYSTKEILSVFDSFDDIPKDANAYRVLALLLENCHHHTLALSYGLRALKLCTEPTRRFRILHLLATIQTVKKDLDAASKSILEGLSLREVLKPKQIRHGLLVRAKIENVSGKTADAIASFEEARVANDAEPLEGNYLQVIFKACVDGQDETTTMEMMKRWQPMERLAWMTWKFNDVGFLQHELFRRIATRAGQQEFMYESYKEAIKLLDNLDGGPPLRVQLARAHWAVGLDTQGAKTLLNEVLDTSSSGDEYALTYEDPAYTLICAVMLMTEIIYEQYRKTSDHTVKAQLYDEIKTLTNRALAQSVASTKSELSHYTLVKARMARKMARAQEFQDTMESAFNLCYEGLVDNVGWNDMMNLNKLGTVLSTLPGLEKEAQILISAQFSKLDPAVENEGEKDEDEEDKTPNGVGEEAEDKDDETDVKEDGDSNEDDEDEEEGSTEEEDSDSDTDPQVDETYPEQDYPLPTDEGDLADTYNMCSGECRPFRVWRAWKNRPMYMCMICSNVCLCEDCYAKRQEYNRNGGDEACKAAAGAVYCGLNHKYIRAPIPGWKGVKDGIMTIEGQDGAEDVKVKFRDWLDELKDVKWKKAWEAFWLNEE